MQVYIWVCTVCLDKKTHNVLDYHIKAEFSYSQCFYIFFNSHSNWSMNMLAPVHLSVCPSVRPYVRMYACACVCTSVCMRANIRAFVYINSCF